MQYLVPVYDGRQGGFSMKKLDRLNEMLEPFEEDLVGKACLVGFTANTWQSKTNNRQLSCNVQWIVVLA
jgi:hypothetical protein